MKLIMSNTCECRSKNIKFLEREYFPIRPKRYRREDLMKCLDCGRKWISMFLATEEEYTIWLKKHKHEKVIFN